MLYAATVRPTLLRICRYHIAEELDNQVCNALSVSCAGRSEDEHPQFSTEDARSTGTILRLQLD